MIAASGVPPRDERLKSVPLILFLSPEPDDCILILFNIDDVYGVEGVQGVIGVKGSFGLRPSKSFPDDPKGGLMKETVVADKS